MANWAAQRGNSVWADGRINTDSRATEVISPQPCIIAEAE
jgi:hypothetical protein